MGEQVTTNYQKQLQEDFEELGHLRDSVHQKWKLFISKLSTDTLLASIKQIYEFSLEFDEIKKTMYMIQLRLQKLNNDDQEDIEQLKEQINELELKLKELNPEPIKTSSWKERCPARLVATSLKNCMSNKEENTPALSHLLLKQPSPSILDLEDNEFIFNESENENRSDDDGAEADEEEEDDDEEMVVLLDSNSRSSKISHKIRFSNNIVRYLRGPFKSLVHGTMHTVDLLAQGTHINETCLHAVKKGLEKQSQQTMNNAIRPAFVDINSEWKLEGENVDRGFSSLTLWMRNSQNQRVLIKIQEHPLCAANEWLAYALGKFLGLPVNEVQIGLYENSLVTIHTDVAAEDEKTVSFMDLPRPKRKALLTDPIMERMDIFDRIIQNNDRNQQNILITLPKTTDINDDSAKVKIHLIDHSNCFGMGKLNGISLVAAKFHSNHLAVVKFDPIQKSKQFEQYLNKLPVSDRPMIGKTLNRYASIGDEQFDDWIGEVQDLLSSSQYNRIHGVLRRQRDIAKRYTTQWGISPRSSSIKQQETKENTPQINEPVSYL